MSNFSNAILVIIFYTVYFLYVVRCNSLPRSIDQNESSFRVGEFPRPNPNWNAMQERKMQYCGPRLHEIVKYVCKSKFYSSHGKRDAIYGPGGFRGETKITMECCKIGCNRTTLLKYCDADPTEETLSPNLATLFHNFFAHSRKLSPLGYTPNFPVPVQTNTFPGRSYSENTEEIDANPKFVPQVVEPEENYPRARLRVIPQSNIVRDADDDYSVFSVGLY